LIDAWVKNSKKGMIEMLPEDLMRIAENAAKAAGMHAVEHRARRREVVSTHKHDLKLVMDVECQAIAERMIGGHCPGDAILGEEGATPRESGREWVIDPIDGTLNYYHGIPHWGCSIGVREKGVTLAGCVFMPETGECFTASKNGPAMLNGHIIAASDVTLLEEAMVLYGLGKPLPETGYNIERLDKLMNRAQKTRVMGAAAPDICLVACGRVDLYIDEGIFVWDYIAAMHIAERAGAFVDFLGQTPDGRERCIAAAPGLSWLRSDRSLC